MKKILLSIITLSCVVTYGQNIFRENFSTYTTGQQLSGQGVWTNNSSNPGGLGTCTGATCANAKVLATAINFGSYGSSPNSFEIKPDTDGCGRQFTPATGADTYFGMVLNISNAPISSPTDFFRVMAGSNTNIAFRVTLQTFGSGYYYVGITKGTGSIVYSTALNTNTSYLVVLRYTKAAGTNDDVLRMYINPFLNSSEPAMPDYGTTNGTDATGNIDRLTFRQNYFTGLPTGRVGLVSVSNSWNTLSFPTLETDSFTKDTFAISSSEVDHGILNIKSSVIFENASLKIYNIQGSLIETKSISLNEAINDIAINPIRSAGVYIVEITSDTNQRFTQKILVN